MAKRLVTLLLIALLAILHAQLWFGRGSVPNVARLQREIEEKRLSYAQATLTNDRLSAEINDLREGLEIVEEKARSDLGLVKNNEIFVQIAK